MVTEIADRAPLLAGVGGALPEAVRLARGSPRMRGLRAV